MNEQEFWASFQPSLDRPGCLVWTRHKDMKGYGHVRYKGKQRRVPRLVWTLKKGDIPPGMCVLHTCDNPPCGEIGHLWLGTIADNNKDSSLKGRRKGIDKLTHLQVDVIRAVYPLFAQKALAKAFGVTPANISCIILNKSWL